MDTAPDTERSVVIRDHPFVTPPGKEYMTCLHCGLAAASHAEHKSHYVSTAPAVPTSRIQEEMQEVREEVHKEIAGVNAKRQAILSQEGHKDDTGKTEYFAMPWLALEEMADVMTFGADKYAMFNYRKGMNYRRLWSAGLRHLVAWWRGEDNDPETGKSHLAHTLCCIAMLLEIQKLKRGVDDRCK